MESGKELIGKKVEFWNDGKFGRYLVKGIVVDYRPRPKSKKGKLSTMKGVYFIDAGNSKKHRKLRSDFKLITNPELLTQ